MEFSKQECWSGCLFPYPEDLPKPGLKHRSLTLQADSYHLSYLGSPFTEDAYTIFSLGVYLCFASVLNKQTVSLCTLPFDVLCL